MGQRQKILRAAVAPTSANCAPKPRVLGIRRRDLAEQMVELKGLRGKNTSVIKHMRARIEQEQATSTPAAPRSTPCVRCT